MSKLLKRSDSDLLGSDKDSIDSNTLSEQNTDDSLHSPDKQSDKCEQKKSNDLEEEVYDFGPLGSSAPYNAYNTLSELGRKDVEADIKAVNDIYDGEAVKAGLSGIIDNIDRCSDHIKEHVAEIVDDAKKFFDELQEEYMYSKNKENLNYLLGEYVEGTTIDVYDLGTVGTHPLNKFPLNKIVNSIFTEELEKGKYDEDFVKAIKGIKYEFRGTLINNGYLSTLLELDVGCKSVQRKVEEVAVMNQLTRFNRLKFISEQPLRKKGASPEFIPKYLLDDLSDSRDSKLPVYVQQRKQQELVALMTLIQTGGDLPRTSYPNIVKVFRFLQPYLLRQSDSRKLFFAVAANVLDQFQQVGEERQHGLVQYVLRLLEKLGWNQSCETETIDDHGVIDEAADLAEMQPDVLENWLKIAEIVIQDVYNLLGDEVTGAADRRPDNNSDNDHQQVESDEEDESNDGDSDLEESVNEDANPSEQYFRSSGAYNVDVRETMLLEGDERRRKEEMLALLEIIAKALCEHLLQILVNTYGVEGAVSAITTHGLPDAVVVAFLRLMCFVHSSATTYAAMTEMLSNPQGQLIIKMLGQYVVIATLPNSVCVNAEQLQALLEQINVTLLRQEYQNYVAIASILDFIDDVPRIRSKIRETSTLLFVATLLMRHAIDSGGVAIQVTDNDDSDGDHGRVTETVDEHTAVQVSDDYDDNDNHFSDTFPETQGEQTQGGGERFILTLHHPETDGDDGENGDLPTTINVGHAISDNDYWIYPYFTSEPESPQPFSDLSSETTEDISEVTTVCTEAVESDSPSLSSSSVEIDSPSIPSSSVVCTEVVEIDSPNIPTSSMEINSQSISSSLSSSQLSLQFSESDESLW